MNDRVRPAHLDLMEFTANEMTAAVQGVARARAAAETEWESLDRFQQFQLLSQVGDIVLPVLLALPTVTIEPGQRATYTDEQIAEVVTLLLERNGADLPPLVRGHVMDTYVATVQAALAHMPVRRALAPAVDVAPDDLFGLDG